MEPLLFLAILLMGSNVIDAKSYVDSANVNFDDNFARKYKKDDVLDDAGELYDAEELHDAVVTFSRLVDYFDKHMDNITVDCLFGLRIAQGIWDGTLYGWPLVPKPCKRYV